MWSTEKRKRSSSSLSFSPKWSRSLYLWFLLFVFVSHFFSQQKYIKAIDTEIARYKNTNLCKDAMRARVCWSSIGHNRRITKNPGIGSSNFKFFSQSEITSFDQIILFKSTHSHVDSWWSDLLIGLGSDKPSYVMSGCKVDFQTVDVVTFHRCDIGNLWLRE